MRKLIAGMRRSLDGKTERPEGNADWARRATRLHSRGDDGHRHRRAAVAHPARAEIGTPVLDALVVGGGPAGLSTALVLGRARRRVLVLDTGRPANAAAGAVGGLLAQGGVAPIELRRSGRQQLLEYPTVELRCDAVVDAEPRPDGFTVSVEGSDARWRTRALVIAHGLRYDQPPLPGIEGLWGRSVFHCPFCDGWEVRDRPLAVHGNGPAAARSALLVASWSSDVVLCTDGPAQLDGQLAPLAQAGVRVREEPILRLRLGVLPGDVCSRRGRGRVKSAPIPGAWSRGTVP